MNPSYNGNPKGFLAVSYILSVFFFKYCMRCDVSEKSISFHYWPILFRMITDLSSMRRSNSECHLFLSSEWNICIWKNTHKILNMECYVISTNADKIWDHLNENWPTYLISKYQLFFLKDDTHTLSLSLSLSLSHTHTHTHTHTNIYIYIYLRVNH